MKRLRAYRELRKLVLETNKEVIANYIITPAEPNHLFLLCNKQLLKKKMELFNNDYVLNQVKENPTCSSLILTDLATMKVKDNELTYYLYKCYNNKLDKGAVFYQLINKETMEPIGDLEFSNEEENIFLEVNEPKFEESSCNAIEAKNSTTENKKIVFLIGNMNEDRLLYDIERLILNTLHNCHKHTKLEFSFIINMAKFGGNFSKSFDSKLEPIKEETNLILKEFRHVNFGFEYAE